MEKIQFKQLSFPCKVGIIGGVAVFLTWTISFLVGFIGALI